MAFIEWNSSLSVKIDSIDNQHKKLVEMINSFYDNIEKKSKNDLISGIIVKMKNYAILHFNTEEKYFKQFYYPQYEQHKLEHDKFIEKVADVEKRFNEGKLVLTLEITNFLKDWLKNHIQGSDMKYSEFLIRNGVK